MTEQSKPTGEAQTAQPQPKQPTAEQIEEALQRVINNETKQYLCDLEIARRVYRSNPELVTSNAFPEPWRTLYAQQNDGQEPNDQETEEAPTIAGLRESLLATATEVATRWANKSTEAA